MQEYKLNDEILRIVQDDYPQSPREWNNLGTIITKKNHHYTIGDIQAKDIDEELKQYDIGVILPVYMLDHSGLSLSTRSFNDPWDSGQIGFIFVTKDKLRKEFSVKRISKSLKSKVKNVLNAEIEEYDQYIRGEVYGFEISKVLNCDLDHEHEEITDSCYGFYGHDLTKNGILDHLDGKWFKVIS